MPEFTRAFKKTDKNGVPYIVYVDSSGNKYFRKGGSRAWRNNNLGTSHLPVVLLQDTVQLEAMAVSRYFQTLRLDVAR